MHLDTESLVSMSKNMVVKVLSGHLFHFVLNPCDYFLWGFLKDRVYRTSPQTIDDLKQAIKTEIMGVRTEVLQSVTDGFKKRIYHLVASEGGHFENLIH